MPQQGRLGITGFPWGQGLLRTECSGLFPMVPFTLPLLKVSGHLSQTFTVGVWWILWTYTSQFLVGNLWLDTPGVFNSQLSTLSLQQFVDYHSGFWYPQFLLVSLWEVSVASGSPDTLFTSPIWLSKLWGISLPGVLPSHGSKRCWFFSLICILFVIRMEWWLSSFLYAELETGTLHPLPKREEFWICHNKIWIIGWLSRYRESQKGNCLFGT